jgi:hypothetical protein
MNFNSANDAIFCKQPTHQAMTPNRPLMTQFSPERNSQAQSLHISRISLKTAKKKKKTSTHNLDAATTTLSQQQQNKKMGEELPQPRRRPSIVSQTFYKSGDITDKYTIGDILGT